MKWNKDWNGSLIALAWTAGLFTLMYLATAEMCLGNRAIKEGVTVEEMRNHSKDRYWVHVTCWNCKGRVSYEPLRGQSIEACLWTEECLWCGVVNANDRHGE